MKKTLELILILCFSEISIAATNTAKLLIEIEAAISEKYRDPSSIVEKHNQSLLKIESFDSLQSNFRYTWQEDMTSFETVAPTDAAKAIFFKAAQNLSRKDYANFLLVTVDLATTGQISKQQFHWAFRPFTKHLIGLWDESPSETLLDVAARSKVVYADNPVMLKFCDGILMGVVAAEAKASDERYYGPQPKSHPTLHASSNNNDASKSSSENMRWNWSVLFLWGLISVTCMVTLGIIWMRKFKDHL
jgi:hypothetical protein